MEAVVLESNDPFTAAERHLQEMVDELRSPAGAAMDMSDLERKLEAEGKKLMQELLQGHMELRGQRQVEGDISGADGVARSDVHRRSRTIETVFGPVEVSRERFHSKGHAGLAPLDGELNLPPTRATLGVRRIVARLAARNSFDEVVESVLETTGARIAKRQAEELAVLAAQDFREFYEQRRSKAEAEQEAKLLPQESDDDDSILVLTLDGKGVPMRRDSLRKATRKAAENTESKQKKRRGKGEKPHRKRMSTVAAVYSIAPFHRSPEDVISGLKLKPGETGPIRPKPRDKRVWASLKETPLEVTREAFAEALTRQQDQNRRWVALVDGNEAQLDNLEFYAEQHGVELTIIIDVIHVLEYLWSAGRAFEREGTPSLEKWVTDRFLKVLQGGAQAVASGLRRLATRRRLNKKARKQVDISANYLEKYQDYLQYDAYLREGLPIATGVIEGACRYLVKDRMEKTGARWGLDGAEAVLHLRSIIASGDFEEYWEFHEEREKQRNHLSKYADARIPESSKPVLPGRRGHLRVVK